MFKRELGNLQTAIKSAVSHEVDLDKEVNGRKALFSFEENRKRYYKRILLSSLEAVKKHSCELNSLISYDIRNQEKVTQLLELLPELNSTKLDNLNKTVKKMVLLAEQLNSPKEEEEVLFKIPKRIPADIKQEVVADLKELEKCFKAGCYRSAVIICGRLLETSLHRKYYEATGLDILEKNPGIGLGNLIAKLAEKNARFDPGLTQQIHLINQVRIFSVHKKKEAFYPSKAQTHAIILYTIDVLEKMF
jgi:hypothetical protein